ncbi:MAG: protein translocase subunit SecD, partial [Candidatus Gottesmanbacteria bacterium]|nr:protein translocase subunit SecD [Candidatus Gottesmanbacteria bacterium]
MFKDPRRVFIIILFLTVLAGYIDLPEKYHPKVQIGPFKKEFTTKFGLDLSGGTQLVLDANMKDIQSVDRGSALESAKQVIERRVNFFGVTEPVVQTATSQNSYRIIVELPGISDVNQAIALIGATAQLEFREVVDPTASESATLATGITGKDLKRAQVTFDTTSGAPQVAIEFNSEGAKKFAEVTKRLVGKPLAIFLDNMPITSPTVK